MIKNVGEKKVAAAVPSLDLVAVKTDAGAVFTSNFRSTVFVSLVFVAVL